MHAATPCAPPFPRLLADVGGTHARLAWQAGPGEPITDLRVLACADHPTLHAAVQVYLHGLGRRPPRAAAIAGAGPITGDEVRMTNHPWVFSQAAFKAAFGLQALLVINDFTALAWALPCLPASELRQVGGGAPQPGAAIAVLGAGTGLGVSGLLPDRRGGWLPIEGEGGHVTLPAVSPRERQLMDGLIRRCGSASAERLLCGQGLVDACAILCEADGVPGAALPSATAVTTAAMAGDHPQATETLTHFCALLGSVAGNLALTLGARGGLYIGGGIVPRLGVWLDRSPFRQRFEAKGRFSAYLQAIPVWVITAAQSPALLGASRALDAAA